MLGKLGFSLSIKMPATQGFPFKIYESFRVGFKPNTNHEKHLGFWCQLEKPEKPVVRSIGQGPKQLFTFTSA
jgi:hypothetical protein